MNKLDNIKKESKFVGLEHMANRVKASHVSRERNKSVVKPPKKKEINPITGRYD